MNLPFRPLIMTCFLLMYWAPANAYIDPGTGSALIQGLIAAIAAIGVAAKMYWHRIVGFFRRKKEEDSHSSPDDGSNER